ncbi:MAG: hypothetical protein R3E53_15760 [Myxococcota bacterium]
MEVTVAPAHHVEDGLLRQQESHRFERVLVDETGGEQEIAERPRRPLALAREVRELFPGDVARADQVLTERLRLSLVSDETAAHDVARVEGEEDGPCPFADHERARLALLTDQLEDLGDAEVAEVPVQRDGHAAP